MNRLARLLLFASVLVIASSFAASADAFLITHGDKVSEFDPVIPKYQPELMQLYGTTNLVVGYKYNHFGVFWLEIWTWDGEWCVYDSGQEAYEPLSKQKAAEYLGMSEDELGKPLRYKFPLGLVILVVLIVLGVLGSRASKSNESKIKNLLSDSRYQQAVAMMQDHQETVEAQAAESGEAPPQDTGGFDKAIAFLTSQGIERAEAEQNLATVLGVLAAAAEQDASPS